MGIAIQKGRKINPPKVVIYGPEGIGKSTLAGKFPGALFVDLEGGTSRLDVARVDAPKKFDDFKDVLKDIIREPPAEYRTLVIDTADKLDGMIQQSVIDGAIDSRINGIEDFGYGKGYTYMEETWKKLLDYLSIFQSKIGWGVVFIAHATMRKIESVGQIGNYDHFELKLSKKASPLLKEWADFLFFLNYDVTLIKGENNKTRAVGGERVLYTNHSNYYDAKSRASLPDSIELDDNGVKAILKAIYPNSNPLNAPAVAHAEPPKDIPSPKAAVTVVEDDERNGKAKTQGALTANEQKAEKVHAEVGCNSEQPTPKQEKEESPVAELVVRVDKNLAEEGLTRADLELLTVKTGMRPKGTPLEKFNETDLKRIIAGWEKVVRNIKKLKEQA